MLRTTLTATFLGVILLSASSCNSSRVGESAPIYVMTVDTNNKVYTVNGKNEKTITKNVTPAERFDKITMGGATNVTVKKGNFSVVITGPQSIVEHTRAEVKNNMLSITPSGPLSVVITMPNLKEIDASGATVIDVADDVNQPYFKIDASGAATVHLKNVKCPEVNLSLAGGSHITVNDIDSKTTSTAVSGGATLDVQSLTTTGYNAAISGGASAKVQSIKVAECNISCSGGSTFTSHGIDAKDLVCNVSGGAGAELGGSAGKADLSASGAGRLTAKKLKCNRVKTDKSFSATITL